MTSTDHAFKEMTEFVITPDDVGRVAVGDDMTSWTLKFWDDGNGYVFERDGDYRLFSSNGSGVWVDGSPGSLIRWKPRTLEAPKRWWNVYRSQLGELVGVPFRSHGRYQDSSYGSPIAVIYARFWHGCEEGRFDTPESVGADND